MFSIGSTIKKMTLVLLLFTCTASFGQIPQERDNKMTQKHSQKMIEDFYAYFNQRELDKIYAMVSDDIVHIMNDVQKDKGKESFIKMMQASTKHYQENVNNVIYMVSDDGKHVATKFTFTGKYINTDDSKVPAKGQPYQASAVNYFEITNGKITTAMGWYDHNDWLKQVS